MSLPPMKAKPQKICHVLLFKKIFQIFQLPVKIFPNPSDITNRNKVTVEICIQGGITAANGFSSNFKVVPVQMVSTIPRLRRDPGQSAANSFTGAEKDASFDHILQKKMSKAQSLDCYTVTYSRDCQLQTFFYQPKREYTY